MITLNINNQDYQINLDGLTKEDLEDIKGLDSEFKDIGGAVAQYSVYIPNIEEQINNQKKEEKTMDSKKNLTPALYIKVTENIGWWVSKEFLEGTGHNSDQDLVKEEKYAILFHEFIKRASKETGAKMMEVLTKKLQEGPKVQSKPKTEFVGFKAGNKVKAVNHMLGLLKTYEGDMEGKGQWLADFIQAQVSIKTSEEIVLGIENNTLYVFFPKNVYVQDRVRYNKAIETIKNSCRGTKLEYGKLVNGQLPIKVRGSWKNGEI